MSTKDGLLKNVALAAEYITSIAHLLPLVPILSEAARQISKKELNISSLIILFLLDVVLRREMALVFKQTNIINVHEATLILTLYSLALGFWFLHRNGNFSDKINP